MSWYCSASTTCNLSLTQADHICHRADVLGAWGSDVGGETDSEDSVSSDSVSGEDDIAGAMQDGLSLQERYPVQSAQDVRGTWTPIQASGQHMYLQAVSTCINLCRKHWVRTGLAGDCTVHRAC